MRIHTKIVWELQGDEWVVVCDEGYDYDGPVDLCGGGKKTARKQQEQISKAQLDAMNAEIARRNQQLGLAEPTLAEFEQEGGSGGLSRYAMGQYGADLENIGNTYGSLRRAALKSLGPQRDAAASGLALTKMNALDQQRGADETAAFRYGLQNTQALKQAALNARLGIASNAGQQSLGSGDLASNAALRRSQMGSTFGDIMGGIGQGVGLIAGLTGPIGALGGAGSAVSGLPIRQNTSFLTPLAKPRIIRN